MHNKHDGDVLKDGSFDLLDILRQNVAVQGKGAGNDLFRIIAVYAIEMSFRPTTLEPEFTDRLVVVQTVGGVGACCCLDAVTPVLHGLVGRDARIVTTAHRCVDIACLDAAYSVIVAPGLDQHLLRGSSQEKAILRAKIVASEVSLLLDIIMHRARPSKQAGKVLMVGAVSTVISELNHLGLKVRATDLDQAVIGSDLSGVTVEDGTNRTLELAADSDVILVTGSSLMSNTLLDIIRVAQQVGAGVIIYAQTGASFADAYIDIGADSVISEKYPFYMIPGSSRVEVYRTHHHL